MKIIVLVLFLISGLGNVNAQNPNCVPKSQPLDDRVQLQLNTTVADQRYAEEGETKHLHLTLNLNYSNKGSRPILLDKKSSVIYRNIVSTDLVAAAACKYVYDASIHSITVKSMQSAGFRFDREPERQEFVTLKPGDSLNLKKEIILDLYDGTKDTEDDLHPGTYLLQVRVATWFYFVEAAEYQKRWRNQGYLWSENMTSEPMTFTVR
jgi:hypothetical protein